MNKNEKSIKDLYEYTVNHQHTLSLKQEDRMVPEKEQTLAKRFLNAIYDGTQKDFDNIKDTLESMDRVHIRTFWAEYGDIISEMSLRFGNINDDILNGFKSYIPPSSLACSALMVAIANDITKQSMSKNAVDEICNFIEENNIKIENANYPTQISSSISSYFVNQLQKNASIDEIETSIANNKLFSIINLADYYWETRVAAAALMMDRKDVAEWAEMACIKNKGFVMDSDYFKDCTLRFFQPIEKVEGKKKDIEDFASFFKCSEIDDILDGAFASYEEFGRKLGYNAEACTPEIFARRLSDTPVLEGRTIRSICQKHREKMEETKEVDFAR